MRSRSGRWGSVVAGLACASVLWACGGKVGQGTDGTPNPPDSGGVASSGGSQIQPGSGGLLGTGGIETADGSVPEPTDPCAALACAATERCAVSSGSAACIPSQCDTLSCAPHQVCTQDDQGARCQDNRCHSALDCAAAQHCDDGLCKQDVCMPFESRCSSDGSQVEQCDETGGGYQVQFTCRGAVTSAPSACEPVNATDAACACLDDWDCPSFTACKAGLCRGTGVSPTCSLPPTPFSDVLPTPEITWGGLPGAPLARVSSLAPHTPPTDDGRDMAPLPDYNQVVQTPVVINLDDDNGDGAIDERDFPEIIFTTFKNSAYTAGGVLRAIHGGGPNKGQDFFASCGTDTWHEGEDASSAACTDPDLDSTSSIAAGDLDNDGVPEIVTMVENDAVRIYSHTGEVLATSATFSSGGSNPGPSLANMDNAGFAEIVVGKHVFTIDRTPDGTWQFIDRFSGSGPNGSSAGQGPVTCIADVVGDTRPELVAGTVAYRLPERPQGVTARADCDPADTSNFCAGALDVVWDGTAINGLTGDDQKGMCAIADVLGTDQDAAPGPDNPLDGTAEVITIENSTVHVFNGQTGQLKRTVSLTGGDGGPPNVDDFDGDGFPEIGSAFKFSYAVIDLQAPTAGGACDAWDTTPSDDTTPAETVNPARTPPVMSCSVHADCGDTSQFGCNATLGQCICLHNSWSRKTEDDSSRVTGSSVFDFNGDGAAEVVYNDECRFRIYDGRNADVLFSEASESRTRIEYPVVADVDNDGNAEIVFGVSNESGFCSAGESTQYNNGLEVWGDASDTWVSARRIWNQHGYHITHITESGHIPTVPPKHYLPHNGRLYNSFRSNPRSFGVAPDLIPTDLQVSSPGAGCGTLSDVVDIAVRIANRGDLRVGPGVSIGFEGSWNGGQVTEPLGDAAGGSLITTVHNSLEPRDALYLTVRYDSAHNAQGTLPETITVVVDDGDQERECLEDNNKRSVDVVPGQPLADLMVQLDRPLQCPVPTVNAQVCNGGTQAAQDPVVRLFAGDPEAGGDVVAETTIEGTIDPGACREQSISITGFPQGPAVRIYAIVDPDNQIAECADGNNRVAAAEKHACSGLE